MTFQPLTNGQALICGGGPCGLVAAITLHQLGWRDIVLVERRPSHAVFERGKAFNYQIDGRGQRALASIGIGLDSIRQYGVANPAFTAINIGPDGIERSYAFPLVRREKQTAYWTTRSALLTMLHEHLSTVNTDGRIRLLEGHTVASIQMEAGRLEVGLKGESADEVSLNPRLILGCDGINSTVRNLVCQLPNIDEERFRQVVSPSPSSELVYKVLRLPRHIPVTGKADAVMDPSKAYVFSSGYTAKNQRLSLFSLPIACPDEPRTANIILPRCHPFWQIGSMGALMDYLRRGFPQLSVEHVFPADEIADFLEVDPGKFPDPQYCETIHAEIGSATSPATCILLGDAAHAFPPDLGLGVNSAMEDVHLLSRELARANADIGAAAARYAAARLPEIRALVSLVRTVFPYQYNQVPWRFKLSMAKFLAQLGLAKLTFGLLDEPGFRLCQDDRLSYTECERRILRSDLVFYALIFLMIAFPISFYTG